MGVADRCGLLSIAHVLRLVELHAQRRERALTLCELLEGACEERLVDRDIIVIVTLMLLRENGWAAGGAAR